MVLTDEVLIVTKERNYGIDLLRIFSMFLVLILHICGQGGLLANVKVGMEQYNVVWFLEIAAYCAVNCYALISGYVGYASKHKYSSLCILWLRVIFYTLGITLLFQWINPELVTPEHFWQAIFPVVNKQYWYFTAYFCLFLFLPILNSGINNISKKQHKMIIIALLFIYSVWGTFWDTNVFGLGGGYSCIWLMILYIVGAYFGKYNIGKNFNPILALAGYFISAIITFICKINNYGLLVSYTSPTIVLEGIFLLLFFKNLQIPEKAKKIINMISPLAFSVYLIHVNYFVWNYWFKNRYLSFLEFEPVKLFFAIMLNAIIIFVICIMIDSVREFIFKKLKLKKLLEKLERKLIK